MNNKDVEAAIATMASASLELATTSKTKLEAFLPVIAKLETDLSAVRDATPGIPSGVFDGLSNLHQVTNMITSQRQQTENWIATLNNQIQTYQAATPPSEPASPATITGNSK
jgi:hypothetical protein